MRNGRYCNAFSTNSKSLRTCNPTLSLALVLLEFAYSCLESAMRYKKLTINIFHKKIALGRVINYLWVMPKMAKDGSELDCDHFQEKLNLLHQALRFTVEKEQNNSLNFLDVLAEKEGTGYLTSIYRKPTFIGQYIRWISFNPKTRNISLIKPLVHKALMICSKTKLGSELDKIKQLLIEKKIFNRFSTFSGINQKLASFAAE